MTIKTQNGKVLTKDGKVSCECCGVECCLYPAQALGDGDYSVNDLPDAVTVDGTSFNRSGTGYGNTTNGVILEGNVWAKYSNGVRSTRPCLIQGGVLDQFADTYTATATSGSASGLSQTLTRQSISEWFGDDFPGQQETGINLFYMRCSIYNEFYPESEWDAWWMTVGAEDPIKKTDPQNSPIGTYGVGIVVS